MLAVDFVNVSKKECIVSIDFGLECLSSIKLTSSFVDGIRGRDLSFFYDRLGLLDFLKASLVAEVVDYPKRKFISFRNDARH